MSYISNIDIRPDSAHLDAFQRLRVSNPTGLFASSFQYTKQPLIFEEILVGAGSATHLPNESSVTLSTGGTTNGDTAALVSRTHVKYQPGKSQLILVTFVGGSPQSNAQQDVGLFDSRNGIFVRNNAGTLQMVRRTYTSGATVDNAVDQGSWNVDPMDGSGVSGITLDWTKAQIFFIDIEWLGVGRVRTGFVVDGKIYVAHQFLNTNTTLTGVYMQTANLPVQWRVYNNGTSGAAQLLKAICCSVNSEGGFNEDLGYEFGRGFVGTTSVGAGAEVPIFAIRPRTTFDGDVNRIITIPLHYDVTSSGNAIVYLIYNPTFTGGAWTDNDTAYSSIEYWSTLGTITGGVRVQVGYVTSSSGRGSLSSLIGARYPIGIDYAGANPRGLCLVAQSLSGTINMTGAMNWRELR